MSTEEVKTYTFSVEKELDVDIFEQSQRLDLRFTKGLMDLYETNDAIHRYRWLMGKWLSIIVRVGVKLLIYTIPLFVPSGFEGLITTYEF